MSFTIFWQITAALGSSYSLSRITDTTFSSSSGTKVTATLWFPPNTASDQDAMETAVENENAVFLKYNVIIGGKFLWHEQWIVRGKGGLKYMHKNFQTFVCNLLPPILGHSLQKKPIFFCTFHPKTPLFFFFFFNVTQRPSSSSKTWIFGKFSHHASYTTAFRFVYRHAHEVGLLSWVDNKCCTIPTYLVLIIERSLIWLIIVEPSLICWGWGMFLSQ